MITGNTTNLVFNINNIIKQFIYINNIKISTLIFIKSHRFLKRINIFFVFFILFWGNCAVNIYGPSGGWWFESCYYSKLNAEWGRSTGSYRNNLWYHWKSYNGAIKASVMKFRCDLMLKKTTLNQKFSELSITI